ncbi:MAG: pitrilysin family protein [Bacteroidales bacterium]
MIHERHQLPNGIRLIHRNSSSPVAHCGLIINTGSRDEASEEQGLAHFIEHVIFKGTSKRKSFHIMSHMENVGGEINAFTTKEETCIYGSFMHHYYERWFDIVSDIAFQSVFPSKELAKEKDIVIDEINAYKDSPAEQIIDDFDEVIFDGHPLGRNILGEPGRIAKFDRQAIHDFIARNYATTEMVICSVGNINFQRFIRLAEKYFGDIPRRERQHSRKPFVSYKPKQQTVKRKNHQAHCMMGNAAYDFDHPSKNTALLLNNILGGPGLTSRLNLAVREKHGFCYTIDSMYQPFSDTGIFSIYFGTDPGFIDKTLKLIDKELARLRNQKLGSLQLKRAKNQLIGQVAIAYESNVNDMLSIGKSLLHSDKVETLIEINEKIEAISASELMDVANELFAPDMVSMLTYKPS